LGAEIEVLTVYQNDIIAAVDFLLSGVWCTH
jgi:hypothetical protein